MDFPSSHHHNNHHHDNRYVTPPPLNDHRNNPYPYPYPYPHHHNRLPPPLPPPSRPPPPPPPSRPPPAPYHSLPPPPPPPTYDPQQPHFTYVNPSVDRQFSSPPPMFSSSHRQLPNRDFLEDDRSRPHLVFPQFDRQFSDYRPIDPPRVPTERHHHGVSPYRPTDALERMPSVFRDGFIDGYSRDSNYNSSGTSSNRISQNRDVLRGGCDDELSYRPRHQSPDRYVPDSKRYTRDVDYDRPRHRSSPDSFAPDLTRYTRVVEYGFDSFTSSSSKTMEDFGGNYNSRHGIVVEKESSLNHRDEDRRWFLDATKKGDFGRRDEISYVSEKGEPRLFESGKFDNKSRVAREEDYHSSPMKQVQKKSVLLRIGKPNNTNRNRSHEHHSSKAYIDDSETSKFRGKDKEREYVPYLDQRLGEEREDSAVDLDVSFKSNALVAKAIVAPSSPAVGSSYVTPPRSKKIRRSTGSDSPLTRVSEQSAKSESSSHGLDCPSRSEKTQKQLIEKGSVCGVESAWDIDSMRCSTDTNDLTRNSAFESPTDFITYLGGNGSISVKPLSDGGKKRKRALLLATDASMQQPIRKEGELVKHSPSALDGSGMHVKGDCTYTPSALDDNSMYVKGYDHKYVPSTLDHGAMQEVSFSSQNFFINEMEKTSQALVQGEDDSAVDTEGKNRMSHYLASSYNPLVNKIETIPKYTSLLAPDIQCCSDSVTILTQNQSESTVCNIDRVEDVNVEPNQNDAPLLLDIDNSKVSPEGMISFGSYDNVGLSSQEDILIHQNSLGSNAIVHSTSNVPSTFCGSSLMKEISTIFDMGTTDSKNSCLNELVTVPPENIVVEGSLTAIPANADETKAQEVLSNVDSCKKDCNINSSSNSVLTNFQAKNIISDTYVDETSKQLSFGEATKSLEKDPLEGSPLPVVPVGDSPSIGSSKDCSPNTNWESEDMDSQSGSSSVRISETPENIVKPTLDTDPTISWSDKDDAVAEDRVSGSRGENAKDVHAEQEHNSRCTEAGNLNFSTAMEISSPDQTSPRNFAESEMLVKDLLPSSNAVSVCADDSGLSATKADEECVPDMLMINMTTLEEVFTVSSSSNLNDKSLDCVTSDQELGKDDNKLHEKPLLGSGTVLPFPSTSANSRKSNIKLTHAKVTDIAITKKTAVSASQTTNMTSQSLNSGKGGLNMARNQATAAASSVTRVFGGRPPIPFTNSRINSPANQIAKPRTWHRMNNTSASPLPPKKNFPVPVPTPPKKDAKVQSSSYVRSGNTLVRKPAAVTGIPNNSPALNTSVHRLNPSGIGETKKNAGSGSKVDVIEATSSLNTGGLTPSIERPKTPPLLHSTKLSDCKPINARVLTSSPLECPSLKDSEISLNNVKLLEHLPVLKVPEDNMKSYGLPEQSGPTSKSESQNKQDEGNQGKNLRYVKRKLNQLVAASTLGDQDVDKTQDGYYKRRKNQLIRTSAGSQVMQRAASQDDPVYSEMQRATAVNSSRSFIKKQSSKGKAKMYKHSRFCSVWTLNNKTSLKHGVSSQRQKGWPHLIPWKRAKDWRSFLHMSASTHNNSSLSLISRKLLLSRKRDTIYTRSPHGFSLRMSKLLSVGGASLKWSKSIEKNSKRANEEATLAVAAVEKEKREKNGTIPSIAGSKSRNNNSRKSIHNIELHPGERIFRIGLVRYKMDRSRRTLQRISDEEPSTSLQSEKHDKRTYVPKRLLIGHDEYVRIGNGNQLVRDPKKRTRIFANEKVRWSLHTARLRLARKKTYCQFFTRFGKCNKDGGRCPYIHDPSKIAVCTKFLNGSCSDTNCKLTHQVIPERMQDCSYFLQGLCSNEHCPYRHVNVNANASPCEGFLKGYCADGNECRKKHTYLCPDFEATGICTQGPTCKLHHPKTRSRGLKRKHQSSEQQQQQKNTRGRYFGSKRHAGLVTEHVVASQGIQASKNENDDIFRFSDYITLDFSDEEETGVSSDPTNEQGPIYTDHLNVRVADIDNLTKPIGIMNINLVTEPLLAFGSPSASLASEESDVCK